LPGKKPGPGIWASPGKKSGLLIHARPDNGLLYESAIKQVLALYLLYPRHDIFLQSDRLVRLQKNIPIDKILLNYYFSEIGDSRTICHRLGVAGLTPPEFPLEEGGIHFIAPSFWRSTKKSKI